jgi:hypothetical protein
MIVWILRSKSLLSSLYKREEYPSVRGDFPVGSSATPTLQ